MFFDTLELIALATAVLGIIVRFTGDLQNATYFVAVAGTMLIVVVIKLLRDLINQGKTP